MTIAAGLLCKEGVVLCADTEHLAWETKSQECKLRSFDFPGGKVLYAYAGNVRFAMAAMAKCEAGLKRSKWRSNPYDKISAILEKEYTRNVLKHPGVQTDGALDYQILVAVCFQDQCHLFRTYQTVMTEVDRFECMGIGEPLATYLIKGAYSAGMPYAHLLPLVSYALAVVKDNVRDCDGLTVISLLSPDGKISTITSHSTTPGMNLCADVEQCATWYDFLTRKLFFHITDIGNGKYFEANFKSCFIDDILKMVSSLRGDRLKFEQGLAEINATLTPHQVELLAAQLSMGLSPNLPPSLESPGGSGES